MSIASAWCYGSSRARNQPVALSPIEPKDRQAANSSPRPTFVCRHCGAPMLVIKIIERARRPFAGRRHRSAMNNRHFSRSTSPPALYRIAPAQTPVAWRQENPLITFTLAVRLHLLRSVSRVTAASSLPPELSSPRQRASRTFKSP
jgi:hypothetical protein